MRINFLALGLTFFFSLFCQTIVSQEVSSDYKTYSFSELFTLIEAEDDTIFKLENAFIKYNPEKDSAFYVTLNGEFFTPETRGNQPRTVNKQLLFINTVFESKAIGYENDLVSLPGINNITFNKKVEFINTVGLIISHCTFNSYFNIINTDNETAAPPTGLAAKMSNSDVLILNKNSFKGHVRIQTFSDNLWRIGLLTINQNTFSKSFSRKIGDSSYDILIYSSGEDADISFKENIINGIGYTALVWQSFRSLDFGNNKFLETDTYVNITFLENEARLNFTKNEFENIVELNLTGFNNQFTLDYDQFQNGLINRIGVNGINAENLKTLYSELTLSDLKIKYKDSIRVQNETVFKNEIGLLSGFLRHYKEKFDTKSANKVYVDLKKLETQRMAFEYRDSPSFENFFTWKINQFLQVFSAYGTRPAKAIVFSLYVILAFALIYLFFPNHWDSHGKNRIKDRFLFFHKYLRHNKGIQDVYLDEQKAELESAYAFQQVLDEHKSEVPRVFYNAAKPLFRWSVAGTTVYAKLLSRVDFLKGSWKDTEPKKRKLKTALTIVIFTIALLYDIFIKMLNALMLSINTFTTLGFGEIPIKGLPRYLAIIEGFIGWFMLTIFSVSLISQLLN